MANEFQWPRITPEFHDVFSVAFGELVDDKWVDWSQGLFDWKRYAHDDEQYARICEGIELRYRYREIAIIPPKRWAKKFIYRIIYELCPKYNPAYDVAENLDLLQVSDKYGKRRNVASLYPETLLSGNSDYLSSGDDMQYEDVEDGPAIELMGKYIDEFKAIDQAFLDDLEIMFSPLAAIDINI